VGFIGSDLCKLRAQITFDSGGSSIEVKRTWHKDSNPHGHTRRGMAALCAPEGRAPEILRFPSRFQVYGMKITPRSGPKHTPSIGETKARNHPCQPKAVLHSLQGPGRNSKTL
jgi:hypothetical protein